LRLTAIHPQAAILSRPAWQHHRGDPEVGLHTAAAYSTGSCGSVRMLDIGTRMLIALPEGMAMLNCKSRTSEVQQTVSQSAVNQWPRSLINDADASQRAWRT
jgi:hypothetical protein